MPSLRQTLHSWFLVALQRVRNGFSWLERQFNDFWQESLCNNIIWLVFWKCLWKQAPRFPPGVRQAVKSGWVAAGVTSPVEKITWVRGECPACSLQTKWKMETWVLKGSLGKLSRKCELPKRCTENSFSCDGLFWPGFHKSAGVSLLFLVSEILGSFIVSRA